MSLNNENICREISENKIAVCEKTAGLRSRELSDLNSACSKVLSPVKKYSSSKTWEMKVNDIAGCSKRPTNFIYFYSRSSSKQKARSWLHTTWWRQVYSCFIGRFQKTNRGSIPCDIQRMWRRQAGVPALAKWSTDDY